MPTECILASAGFDPSEVTLQFVNRFGRELPYYDDGIGKLYAYSTAGGGVERFIRAYSWESAYDIMLDESTPIPPDMLWEAYGFDSPEEFESARTAKQNEFADTGKLSEPLELVEGYQYQSNSSGTGIVAIDLNGESLDTVTAEWLDRHEITMRVVFA